MKPSVPETGMIISLEGDKAHIILQSSGSCKGCGAAKLGLCKPAGNMSALSAKNTLGAVVGDIVKIELDSGVQTRGYFLAFIIPVFSLIIGTIAGYVIGGYFSIPALEAVLGFIALFLTSFYSLKRLKRLNASSTMVIKEIVSGNKVFTGFTGV